MELTKHDNQIAKGIAIIGMVMLHLFSRLGELPYSPLIWIGKTPLIFYVGLLGDMCVRRHITGGENRTLISVKAPLRLCRTGTCRRLSAV